jgi:hypothetical protein
MSVLYSPAIRVLDSPSVCLTRLLTELGEVSAVVLNSARESCSKPSRSGGVIDIEPSNWIRQKTRIAPTERAERDDDESES